MQLRIAGTVKESVVDGPGIRYVVFTQGCPRCCPGCHNPATQDFQGGYIVEVQELVQEILALKLIAGVTLSGGEPFAQAAACSQLAQLVKAGNPQLNILVYSGAYHSELLTLAQEDPSVHQLLEAADILIDGPFDITQKSSKLAFRGSSNQSIIYLKQDRFRL